MQVISTVHPSLQNTATKEHFRIPAIRLTFTSLMFSYKHFNVNLNYKQNMFLPNWKLNQLFSLRETTIIFTVIIWVKLSLSLPHLDFSTSSCC